MRILLLTENPVLALGLEAALLKAGRPTEHARQTVVCCTVTFAAR
jgi:hypothetical protein